MNTISNAPLRGRDYWIVAVSSMEQVIGACLSTLIGIMLPMMQLATHTHLASWLQGIIGATGLIGIGIGSLTIGKMIDRQGYLGWFRVCPLLIVGGALVCIFLPNVPCLIAGLLIVGIGVGGGYSLDSAYISELLPERWRQTMVGVAKASSSIGFISAAAICWVVLVHRPDPGIWNRLMIIIAAFGAVTFLMRLRWAQSPKWLMERGRTAQAAKATSILLGKDVTPDPAEPDEAEQPKAPKLSEMLRGDNLKRVIFSGIPWACEGLGVYGVGIFLPVLVIALGIESSTATGMVKIINSVRVTTMVNFFILPGFIIGLLLVNRLNRVRMMVNGFLLSAAGLLILYFGFRFGWPTWSMIAGFIVFEVALNAGPHLITFILPSQIYPVADRGTGTGIAAMLGKAGAVLGVVVMPILLEAGGVGLVMIVSASVMLAGALIGWVFGKMLKMI